MPRHLANASLITSKAMGAKCALLFCPGAEKFFQKGVDKCDFMVYNESIK